MANESAARATHTLEARSPKASSCYAAKRKHRRRGYRFQSECPVHFDHPDLDVIRCRDYAIDCEPRVSEAQEALEKLDCPERILVPSQWRGFAFCSLQVT